MKIFKLDPKKKKLWVKALRSGKYKQARERLCVTGYMGNKCFCCLGVACEIGIARARRSPLEHIREAHISLSFIPDDIEQKLIGMNDEKRFSFKRIATWIEKHL